MATIGTCTACLKRSSLLMHQHLRKLNQPVYVTLKKYSTEPLAPPSNEKVYPEHIVSLVDSISKLNLLEVSHLNKLLKTRLNIQDVPMMPMGGMVAPAAAEVEEETAPVEEQTEFTVKLLKFDDSKKVKLIKEIKAVLTDMNLVQAKKFVESIPQVVKEKLSKEDAKKLKTQLEEVGATIEID